MFRLIICACLLQFTVGGVIHGRVLIDGDPARSRRLSNEAVLTVELRDGSLLDAPSTIVKRAEFHHLVAFPIFYELEIPASISPASTYLLIAQVKKGDKLLFTNDVRVPVQTDADSSVEIDIPVIDVNIDAAKRQEIREKIAHTWSHLFGQDGDEAVKYIKEHSDLTNVYKLLSSEYDITDYQKDRVVVVVDENNVVIKIPQAG